MIPVAYGMLTSIFGPRCSKGQASLCRALSKIHLFVFYLLIVLRATARVENTGESRGGPFPVGTTTRGPGGASYLRESGAPPTPPPSPPHT